MATTTAKNRKDVENMSAEERAWDSLNYSYGKKRESSNKSYNKAISQQDRTMQRRGMGRSSYGMQTLAGLQNEKNKAANDIYSEQIADYENRRYQIDRDKVADEQWERTFGENQRQFNENLKENQRQFDTKNVQWWNEFNENARQFNENLAENKRQYDTTEANKVTMWSNEFNANREDADWNKKFQWEQWQQNQENWLKEFNAGREDAEWNKTFQWDQFAEGKRQYDQNFKYQKERDAVSDDQWKQTFDYGKERDTVSDDQWKQSFDYNKEHDAAQIATQNIQWALQMGTDVDDATLAKAGMTRAEFNALRVSQAVATGGGGGGSPKKTEETTTNAPTDSGLFGTINNLTNKNKISGASGTAKKPAANTTTMTSGQYYAYQAQQNANKKTTDKLKK